MNDKHYLAGFNSSVRYEKKRASVDSSLKPERKAKNNERESKRQISELFIDLNGSRNATKLSLNRNFTHRVDSNHSNTNLCDMRSEIEQLRMENQSLRQQIKSLKNNESEFKFEIAGLKKQWRTAEEKCSRLDKQNQALEDKIEQYGKKIKQLFESLIEEKKRKVEAEARPTSFKMVLSPSNSSISASLNLRKCEDQGYIDYFNNKVKARYIEQPFGVEQNSKIEYRMVKNPVAYSHQSSESSPSQRLRSGIGIGQMLGNKY